jgi:DNA modification methylase
LSVRVLEGHILSVLEQEPAGHYHVCVTSPPYWQLRAYGTEPQVWDAAEDCQHEWGAEGRWYRGGMMRPGDLAKDTAGSYVEARASYKQSSAGQYCARCHAWRGELGQEPTPELYVAHLVACFRAVRRVLRDDGTLWVNLAGCYFNDPGGQNGGQPALGAGSVLHGKQHDSMRISAKAMEANRENGRQQRGRHPWLKPLDWVDVPGLFARAMQQDGWLWRSDVTWVKPSALPESVSGTRWERCRVKAQEGRSPARNLKPERRRGAEHDPCPGFPPAAEWADCPGCPRCAPTGGYVLRRGNGRPTKSTERILLFAKKPGYFFDAEAVRETEAESTAERAYLGKRDLSPRQRERIALGFHGQSDSLQDFSRTGRNLRDFWIMSPEPLKDAHYAAYPTALPERCIKAGTSEWGCCPACGSPWARVITRGEPTPDPRCWSPRGQRVYDDATGGMVAVSPETGSTLKHVVESTTLGWRPTCRCQPEQPPVPCRVLDPFAGSGSTLLAANRLGRDATGVDLKPAYAQLARKRIGREPLSLFASRPEEVPV